MNINQGKLSILVVLFTLMIPVSSAQAGLFDSLADSLKEQVQEAVMDGIKGEAKSEEDGDEESSHSAEKAERSYNDSRESRHSHDD
ncbi:MAG: hypothetical protein GXP13_09835 [Gammaproteobacteria bacterium]|nr:hypothetical protein [Gammaproteobacteria bacterium]